MTDMMRGGTAPTVSADKGGPTSQVEDWQRYNGDAADDWITDEPGPPPGIYALKGNGKGKGFKGKCCNSYCS